MKQEIHTPAYQNLYNDHKSYIMARGYKGSMYQNNVRDFLIWLESQGITRIKEVTTSEMMHYYEFLTTRTSRRGGQLAESTIKMNLLAINIFFENLLAKGDLDKGILIPRHGGEGKNSRNTLTVDEVKELYQNCNNLRDKAILALGYGCGLRRTEMAALSMNDVQLFDGNVIVRKGKGNKRRDVPMSDRVQQDLKEYVLEYRYTQLQGLPSEPAFFINRKGKRMCGDSLYRAFKKLVKRTSNQAILNKDITLHCLRHSIASHLLEKEAGIDFIRNFLGHSFIDTAFIYAKRNKNQHQLLRQNHE